MEKFRFVTTSWDDGDRADLKLARMLRDRAISGSFYVPILPFSSRPALTHQDLRFLSSDGFEIGAHGVSHVRLAGLKKEQLIREVADCKCILEDIVGKEIGMFCYPQGRFDVDVVRALEDSGYLGARTVRMLSTSLDFRHFEMPTTVQLFPHSRSAYLRNILRAREVSSLQTCISHAANLGNWLRLAKRLFDSVFQQGGVWHLYGHSWEIDKLGLWQDLEELLDYVSNRAGVTYVTNSELLHHSPRRITSSHSQSPENTHCL
jgi:peptidoglycan/xylan/chitin deacetylase (PgdA/CDA1 family)